VGEPGVLRFGEKVMLLLDQAGFTATYKYAVLLALMDLCLEGSARDGTPPSTVTTSQLAAKIVELYWPQTRGFEALGKRAPLQNRGGQAEILTLIARFRQEHAPEESATLFRAKLHDPERFARLVREVEWKLVEMPLPKLQRVGREVDPFIYQIAWDDRVKRRTFNSSEFDNRILFRAGASRNLVDLAGLLRPLIRRHWLDLVTRLNHLPESALEQFLFGEDRTALGPVRSPLLELQGGRCFYCAGQIRDQAQVDHFLPWARHPDDGIANLVVAHARCNRHKSDFLADVEHVGAWVARVTNETASLDAIASSVRWPTDLARTVGALRGVYVRLPDEVRLWRLEKDFVPMDRARLTAALGPLTDAVG
jgi:hypothetical protein